MRVKFRDIALLFNQLRQEYSVEEIMMMPVIVTKSKVEAVIDENEMC